MLTKLIIFMVMSFTSPPIFRQPSLGFLPFQNPIVTSRTPPLPRVLKTRGEEAEGGETLNDIGGEAVTAARCRETPRASRGRHCADVARQVASTEGMQRRAEISAGDVQ